MRIGSADRPPRILFVNDEDMIVEMVTEMLGELGYEAVGELCCDRALEVFAGSPERFDLVILDHGLPGTTGIDVAEEFLKLRPGIPILLHTGSMDEELEEKARAAGIKGVIRKPLTTAELAAAIEEVLVKDGTQIAGGT
jgi:CheY-like chemotaxis protein